jgi:hypothetical protein
MSVPPGVRLAMPQKNFFFEKPRAITTSQVQRILAARKEGKTAAPSIYVWKNKVKSHFGVKIDPWKPPTYHRYQSDIETSLMSHNCHLEEDGKLPKWKPISKNQVSAILWLSDGPENFVKFPYLVMPPADLDPKFLTPVAGKLAVFPSHPMYAFQYQPTGNLEVHFLIYHATAII